MLPKLLRRLLNERGLSISELARRTNVPKTNLNSWLQGSSPNVVQLDKVARFFGVSIEYLVFGRKEREPIVDFLEKIEVYEGEYEVSIRKIVRKK